MNAHLFSLINGWAGHYLWLDRVMVFAADSMGYFMIAVLIAFVAKDYRKYRDMALVALGSAIVSRFVIAALIKSFYVHPRPYWILNDAVLFLPKELENSFPSGHASIFFALSAGVYGFNKKLGLVFFVLSALMGLARVYSGVHWPLDIVGGVLLGVVVGWLGYLTYKRFGRN